jgi:transposase
MDGAFVGIDVSKKTLDGCIRQLRRFQFGNDARGIQQLVELLQQQPIALVVFEATGGLEVSAVRALQKANIAVAVVNPRQARDFAKATGVLAKTDRIDAEVLAHFAEAVKPQPRAPYDELTQALDALVTRRCQLIDMRTMETNRLHSCTAAKVRESLQEHIDWLNERLDQTDRELDKAVRDHPQWEARDALQQSLPGIGKIVSRTLLADLPELGKVSGKRISALVGLAPFAHDSGQHRGKRFIYGGRNQVRKMLYMAALTASRSQSVFGEMFRRLRERGKTVKVALTAVARKLLTVANAVVASAVPFDNAHAAAITSVP